MSDNGEHSFVTNDWSENRELEIKHTSQKSGDFDKVGLIKVDISWEIANGKIDPNTFDQSGFLDKTDDLNLYKQQRAASRKKWQDLRDAYEIVTAGYKRWKTITKKLVTDRTDAETAFMDDYQNWTASDWSDTVDNAETKCQQALDQFTKVKSLCNIIGNFLDI